MKHEILTGKEKIKSDQLLCVSVWAKCLK